ncbi:MAG: CsbD family protein [Planctomycetota bacterium]|nr:MAG: CsbD family protein [Planctomycetota bacterium]
MNWDTIKGNWLQVRGKAREKWGKLTDDDLDRVAGVRDQLVGKVQERYGVLRDEAEKQVGEWERASADWERGNEPRGVTTETSEVGRGGKRMEASGE